MTTPVIRDSRPGDAAALDALYSAGFPDENLVPLVRSLGMAPGRVLSLVAETASGLIGHVAFTDAGTVEGSARLSLLGPLVVAEAARGTGVARALIETGIDRLRERGTHRVFVLGDPALYGRFGFQTDHRVTPPHPIPEKWREAWQSVALSGDEADASGRMTVPDFWDDPALWSD